MSSFRTLLVIACLAGCEFRANRLSGDAGGGDDAIDAPDGGVDAAIPWLDPWTHRRAITLLASQIEAPQDGALVGFPVLISVVDPDLGAVALPDGRDIVFTASNATTPLQREVESYAAGQLVAWVRLPALPATTDTTIYLYYGHATAPAPPEAVWTEQFLAVYHLQQDPGPGTGGDIRDATAANRDGTAEGSMESTASVPGQVGRGIVFDGGNDCIDLPSMDVGNAFTIALWVKMDNAAGVKSMLSNSSDGANTNGFRFFVNTNGTADRRIHFETGNSTTSNAAISGGSAITNNEWSHVAVAVDRGAGTATIVVDGAIVNAGDTSIRNDFNTSSDLEIGRMETNNVFPGTLDEVSIASAVRPVEWLRTAYNNQRAPASFHVLGPVEIR